MLLKKPPEFWKNKPLTNLGRFNLKVLGWLGLPVDNPG